jgi:hypothetical protein
MIIPGDEVVYKSAIGKLGDSILWGIGTIGGLHLVESRSPNGSRTILGAGSHRAVARHIAKKTHADIEWSVLEKSSDPDLRDFEDILPFWEQVVIRANKKLS